MGCHLSYILEQKKKKNRHSLPKDIQNSNRIENIENNCCFSLVLGFCLFFPGSQKDNNTRVTAVKTQIK